MSDELLMSSANGGTGGPNGSNNIFFDALRFWEPRRILYNAILTGVVLAWILLSWPHFEPALKFQNFLIMLALAGIANVCYCAAYLADLPMQSSLFRTAWRQRRWILWLAGMCFAVLIANYWIVDEIYPYVR